MQITTIGLDIAKNVFRVNSIDAAGEDRRQEAASPRSGDQVFRSAAALPGWHGGLRHSALSDAEAICAATLNRLAAAGATRAAAKGRSLSEQAASKG